jgi:hypothetical protein
MKKEMFFIAVLMVLGIVIGLVVLALLAAIAVPNYSDTVLSMSEKAALQQGQTFGLLMGKNGLAMSMALAGLIAVLAGALLMKILNPNIKLHYKERTEKLKFFAVALGSGACLVVLIVLALRFDFLGQDVTQNSIACLLFIVFTGLLWLLAGEMGWAGDFKAWTMGVQGRAARPIASFLLGSVAGGATVLVIYLSARAFTTYFILSTEVLDGSDFSIVSGLKFMAYEISITSFLLMGILGGLITALSPAERTVEQRVVRLLFPIALSMILAAIGLGLYQHADAKYDLGKKDLAAAVGVPAKALSSNTVVLFNPGKALLQEWPLEVTGYGRSGPGGAIALSRENLEKVEAYLDKHKEGSLFTTAAHDVLIKGAFHLLDAHAGLNQEFKSSKQMLLPRLMLLSQLRYLPVVPENLSYLRSFTDESQWYVGGKYALIIAEGFMHYGMKDEAAMWAKKAREKSADVSKAIVLKEPVFKTGKVFGSLTINGNAPAHTKVAILRYSQAIDKLSDIILQSRLIAVREVDGAGRFIFDRLGKGEYLLLFMTDNETVPFNISAKDWNIAHAPGVIKLDTKTAARNLGAISITINNKTVLQKGE